MILTCENCDSRYHVNQESLGLGRSVRCTSCQHIWFQETSRETLQKSMRTSNVAPLKRSRKWRWLSLWTLLSVFVAFGIVWGWSRLSPHWTYVRNQFRVISGFLSATPPEPLEIFKLSSPQMTYMGRKNGVPQVRVSGSVTNVSSKVHSLPSVKVHLWGPKHEEDKHSKEHPPLETRSYSLGQSNLLPGEILDYSFDFSVDPSMTSTSVGF